MVQKIISYNVNGLRAALNKDFANWLAVENPNVICLQETKIQAGQVDTTIFERLGYNHYWHFAEKKGYSGTAILCKQKPLAVEYGIQNPTFDIEGRTVIAHFENYSIVSAYFPSGSSGDSRQEYKMEFLAAFYAFTQNFIKKYPRVIIAGDYNICHKPIDINHPERHLNYSGFLPEERAWMDEFVNLGLTDTFRVYNQQPNQYSWWSYRAGSRAKNLGWRIDYHMITKDLHPMLQNAYILPQVMHSDHCPVVVELI